MESSRAENDLQRRGRRRGLDAFVRGEGLIYLLFRSRFPLFILLGRSWVFFVLSKNIVPAS